MIWDQTRIGIYLLLAGSALLGCIIHLPHGHWLILEIPLLTGSICTIRQCSPFLVADLKLDND